MIGDETPSIRELRTSMPDIGKLTDMVAQWWEEDDRRLQLCEDPRNPLLPDVLGDLTDNLTLLCRYFRLRTGAEAPDPRPDIDDDGPAGLGDYLTDIITAISKIGWYLARLMADDSNGEIR